MMTDDDYEKFRQVNSQVEKAEIADELPLYDKYEDEENTAKRNRFIARACEAVGLPTQRYYELQAEWLEAATRQIEAESRGRA